MVGILGPDELGGLIDRHSAGLELFARQWTDSAADVVQMAFVKLAALPARPDHVLCWLHQVVRNQAISAARSEISRRHRESAAAEQRPEWFVSSTEDRLDAVEASRALAELPQAQREVIVARLWSGLTFQEIADVLEISSSSAHRHYEAGLMTLREKLGVTWLKNRV